MIFEKEKYYNYITKLEQSITVIYAIIMILSIIIGLAMAVVGLFITVPIGFALSYLYTFGAKVKVQEMKMKFDLYNKIIEK